MTHDQTTPAPVEVTQADRDRAAKFISESDGDFAELAALFAAHRIAHSAPAGEVEPVAWMYAHPDGRSAVVTGRLEKLYERFGRDESWTETPLYTHPAPPADLVELVEAAWRAGFQTARDCLPDDADDVLTEDVEHDQWLDSNTRAALAKHGGA